MFRSLIRNVTFLAALGLGLVGSTAQAGFTGSFAVAGLNTAFNTPGLGAATTFTFSSTIATANGLNGFAPPGIAGSGVTVGDNFATTALTVGGTTFSLSNSADGTFTETVAPVLKSESIQNGTVIGKTFYVLGVYTGGAVGTTPVPASFTISFTQDGGPGSSISSSGTLNIPPAGFVPEPASVAMLGLGLAGVGGLAYRRRNAK